jgi:hypothetical protein
VSVLHIELVLGGLLTGALIGFFWPPAAALVAMLTAAAVSLRA